METTNQKTPIEVLKGSIELLEKKSRDYQNPNSTVLQADYYIHGCLTIYDIMHAKMLRIKSVMEAMESDGYTPNFESLKDSAIDLINYSSFFVSYLEGGIQGQDPEKDYLNRKK